jgi:hypothetical protein
MEKEKLELVKRLKRSNVNIFKLTDFIHGKLIAYIPESVLRPIMEDCQRDIDFIKSIEE